MTGKQTNNEKPAQRNEARLVVVFSIIGAIASIIVGLAPLISNFINPTVEITSTLTLTPTYTITPTNTGTSSNTPTATTTGTSTNTPTMTKTPTATSTATPSATRSTTIIPSATYTGTPTRTNTISTPVQCGHIIEAEFQQNAERHDFLIEMNPGDSLNVSAMPLGDFLNLSIAALDPTGRLIALSEQSGYVLSRPVIETSILPARGRYTILVSNSRILTTGDISENPSNFGGIGVYTLFISCTLRDGTMIAPGDIVPTQNANTPDVTRQPTFSGYGFPGLQAVDFTQGVTIPLMFDTPSVGSISDGFAGIFGFTFTANEGDIFDLSFERLAGNLNLGLAVLSEQNEIAFQASLVTSSTLSTRFTLPSTGEYTIGVFRIDLLPPDASEATTFQITGTVNP